MATAGERTMDDVELLLMNKSDSIVELGSIGSVRIHLCFSNRV